MENFCDLFAYPNRLNVAFHKDLGIQLYEYGKLDILPASSVKGNKKYPMLTWVVDAQSRDIATIMPSELEVKVSGMSSGLVLSYTDEG